MSLQKELYDQIFQRKSFHLYRDVGDTPITDEEIEDIENAYLSFKPLDESIKTKIVITKDDTTIKRGQEYVVLFYSEKKGNYLQNIGYLGEQLDLYLVKHNIGSLWCGMAKTSMKERGGMTYIISMCLRKVDDLSQFRKDMFSSKRKDLKETWHSDKLLEEANIARFAPSACNSQPWDMKEENGDFVLTRVSKKIGLMTPSKAIYFNSIDIGIYMCIFELVLEHNNIEFTKTLVEDNNPKVLVAENARYKIKLC